MEDQDCSVEGCKRPIVVKARALCRMHYTRWNRTGDTGGVAPVRLDAPPEERWLQQVDVQSPGCWVWTGSVDKNGYGQIDVYVEGKRKNWRAHRYVYTLLVRDLLDTETLDHLCRQHDCVNPDHLDPVSHLENVVRGAVGKHHNQHAGTETHCAHGHERTPANIGIDSRGFKYCKACNRDRSARYMRERRAKNPGLI